MCKKNLKNGMRLSFAILCLSLLCAGQAFSKPKKTDLVKEEEGFYYGYGKANTQEEALALAKKDLLEAALTATLRLSDPKAARISVSDKAATERLTGLKPIYPKEKVLTNVVYKVSLKDWEKDSKAYEEKLRSSLAPLYSSITVKGSAAEKINKASEILNTLAECGQADLLTLQAGGTELFARKVESVCQSIVGNLEIAIATENGFVGSDTVFAVSVKDKAGSPVSNLSLKALWEVPGLSISTSYGEIQPVVSVLTTDENGSATVDFPLSEEFKNKILCLTVSTPFSMSPRATKAMRKLDAESSVEAHYVYFENLEESFKSVGIKGGEYKTGAVPQDTRAGVKEKERTVTLRDFAIDLAPVTNFQYAAYIYLTDSASSPEFFDNSNYNQDSQPVVGISAADAESYAEWLSSQTGEKYRLPTDDEWEVAARAGTVNVYPWGDDAPNKSKAANFKGNGKFTAPSPVGSFMNGANAWGLVDMAGNVWEWTSGVRAGEEGFRTVKGGSWMDGPIDLRISNYKNIDSEIGLPDVGFRLVKDAVVEEISETENTENSEKEE